MVLTKNNLTVDDSIGIASNEAILSTHTHNSGTDDLLVVNIFYISSNTTSSLTWDGVSMTKLFTRTNNVDSANIRWDLWYKAGANSGNKTLTATFGINGGTCAMMATSFLGAEQTSPLAFVHTLAETTPVSKTITISQNSMIMGIGTSLYTFSATDAISIAGTSYGFGSCDIDTAVSSAQICAQTRDANLNAGNKNVTITTIAPSFKATNTRVEIKESTAPPSSRRRVIIT